MSVEGRSLHSLKMSDAVRLDVWLDVACLFKTRSEAQRACKMGRVSVNGTVAKPHRELAEGDEIVISRPGARRQTVVVLTITDKHVPKAEARTLYDDRTPPPSPEELEVRRMERLLRASAGPAPRLDRRNQRHAAKRKWTT
jgi:ribosome-associated heat shock protein Hsp15